jgi:hypothetical protein
MVTMGEEEHWECSVACAEMEESNIIQEFKLAQEALQLASSRQEEAQEHLQQLFGGGGDRESIWKATRASADAIEEFQECTNKVATLQQRYNGEPT